MYIFYKVREVFLRLLSYYIRPSLYRSIGGQISKKVRIRENCTIYGDPRNLNINEKTWINKNVFFDCTNKVTIGKHVGIAFNVTINTSYHQVDSPIRCGKVLSKEVIIGDNCWICNGVIINPGITIGEGAIIASGAVVTKDVPPNTLFGGIPAQLIKNLD